MNEIAQRDETFEFEFAAQRAANLVEMGIIINQYKRFVTIQSRKIQNNFKWQSRFYDRIIRDEIEYQQITQYIINNPANWDADRNNRGQQ